MATDDEPVLFTLHHYFKKGDGKPWVARLTGLNEKYVFDREFEPSEKRVGCRAYVIRRPGLYECRNIRDMRHGDARSYFMEVGANGAVRTFTEQARAKDWLKGDVAPPGEEAPVAAAAALTPQPEAQAAAMLVRAAMEARFPDDDPVRGEIAVALDTIDRALGVEC